MNVSMMCMRFPPAPGGTERHVLELGRELTRRGHRVRVLTSDMYCDTPLVKLKRGPRLFRGEVRRSFAFTIPGEADFPMYPGIGLGALRDDADVFHSHGYGAFHTLLHPIVGNLRGRKLVFTLHFHPDWSDWGGSRRLWLRKLFDRRLGPWSTGPADDIIVHTALEKRLAGEYGLLGGSARVHIVPSGIDTARFARPPQASFRQAMGICPDERVVLYVGRVAQKKGLEFLLECAPAVLARFPRTRFVVVGEDMGLGRFLAAEVRKRGLRKNFLIAGPLDDDMLVSAYHSCDLLVLPSEYEAFGLVLAEGMACGRPCVATDVGGVPEVVEHGRTGVLVPPRDRPPWPAP
jgi:glycosyltransferase involved in cell wall biosynthesis